MESESLGNSHKGSEAMRSKNGRGLLSIVEKGFWTVTTIKYDRTTIFTIIETDLKIINH